MQLHIKAALNTNLGTGIYIRYKAGIGIFVLAAIKADLSHMIKQTN